MCGIAGVLQLSQNYDILGTAQKMGDSIAHRGPDDSGFHFEEQSRLALVHRRLSIIDTSSFGHQPMKSNSGQYILIYNGEIYNFQEIRDELERGGFVGGWKGHSDTEVLLAAIETWGVFEAVKKFTGMFAFAVWDRKNKVLTLCRDRVGEKPLYYGKLSEGFFFGSELKAIRAAGVSLKIDHHAGSNFLQFGYIPKEQSIYQDVYKLLPGHVLEVSERGTIISNKSYWSLNNINQNRELFNDASDESVINSFHEQLSRSVKNQMISDVPIGAFLSGGIDSSAITAIMQGLSSTPINTFTIGFEEKEFNEAPFAAKVAQHLGTNHTELYISSSDAISVIPSLATIYDEPFADSSQIPTLLVSKLARQKVTVALSGDGGDELFGGYTRYQNVSALWKRIHKIPELNKRIVVKLLQALSPSAWDRIFTIMPFFPLAKVNGRRIHRLATLLDAHNIGEMYIGLMSTIESFKNFTSTNFLSEEAKWQEPISDLEKMRRWDIQQYLPDDLLVKVDRATMNFSLETRAPLLDHKLIEMAIALPDKFLIRNGNAKWILKQILYKHVPAQMFDRPKAGFAIPLSNWLRESLRGWGEDLIHSNYDSELIDKKFIIKIWNQHQSGEFDRSSYLWNCLTYLSWLSASNKKSD